MAVFAKTLTSITAGLDKTITDLENLRGEKLNEVAKQAALELAAKENGAIAKADAEKAAAIATNIRSLLAK